MELLTEQEAAQMLKVSKSTLAHSRIGQGRVTLPVIKVGGSVRYSMRDIERYLEANTRIAA